MSNLYAELKIWKRRDDGTAVLYRCFQDLSAGGFAVQSADFFKLPIDELKVRNSEKQLIELFIETAPRERCDWFPSISEALAAHDRDFA